MAKPDAGDVQRHGTGILDVDPFSTKLRSTGVPIRRPVLAGRVGLQSNSFETHTNTFSRGAAVPPGRDH